MTTYYEHRFYSSELDTEAVRLSMANDKGTEYFVIVEGGSGKAWRERKARALEALDDAIRLGRQPGLVSIVAGER